MIEGNPPAAYPVGIDLVIGCPLPDGAIISLVHMGEIDIDTVDFVDPL